MEDERINAMRGRDGKDRSKTIDTPNTEPRTEQGSVMMPKSFENELNSDDTIRTDKAGKNEDGKETANGKIFPWCVFF